LFFGEVSGTGLAAGGIFSSADDLGVLERLADASDSQFGEGEPEALRAWLRLLRGKVKAPDTWLPTEMELAQQYGVSMVSVRRAIASFATRGR
jgi:hypothetical protein